ncbi:hypothetical protein CFP56_021438 [Quercus suber]|uniref:Uncharacterized protein n=1 Tax=Quercus suber TaxID=58331 RepID=A0AAW0KDD3_QUESU
MKCPVPLRLERGGEQRIRERLRRSSWRLETRERRRAETREKGNTRIGRFSKSNYIIKQNT